MIVTGVLGTSEPMLHVTRPPVAEPSWPQVPNVVVALTNATSAGSVSVTCAVGAVLGG